MTQHKRKDINQTCKHKILYLNIKVHNLCRRLIFIRVKVQAPSRTLTPGSSNELACKLMFHSREFQRKKHGKKKRNV